MSTYEFRLPDIGEGLEEAEIVEWLVAPGDVVRRDQPLVEVLTDKSQTELPAPAAGTISSLHHDEGDIAKVGELLVVIATGSDSPAVSPPVQPGATDPTPAAPAAAAESPAPAPGSPREPTPPAQASGARRVKASPATRRRAREASIDLTAVSGTGPGGRITASDLDAAIAAPPQQSAAQPAMARQLTRGAADGVAAGGGTVGQLDFGSHPLRGIRRVTAKAMSASWSIPHIHGMDEVDASNLLAGRARIKELLGTGADHLTPLAFLVTAVARALRRYPLMNASIDMETETIVVHERVNIGVAVATDQGLVVPVVTDADQRDLLDLASEIGRLSLAARDRSISAGELRGGTATVTNYGSLGGRLATPIIRAPEVAIVGFGSIRQRPFVVDGGVVARPTLPIATGADHRLIDGDVLTAFQEHVAALITDPVALMVS